MTRNAIAEKLGVHMNKPPADEQDLLYSLLKIRKVLEHDKQRSAYWTLTFFCDWVLHTELDRAGAKKILDMLDKRLGHFNPAKPESIDPDGMVQKILSFELFREHLLNLLRRKWPPYCLGRGRVCVDENGCSPRRRGAGHALSHDPKELQV